jgi:hypothetical protein
LICKLEELDLDLRLRSGLGLDLHLSRLHPAPLAFCALGRARLERRLRLVQLGGAGGLRGLKGVQIGGV